MIKESPELRAITERFLASAQRRDGALLARGFLRAPATRYIGTDPEEWWNGTGFVDAYPNHVARWPELTVRVQEVEAFESGDVGWSAAMAESQFGDAAAIPVRFTLVFVLEPDGWRVVQMHSSVATANIDWVGVELTGSLEQLLASLGPQSGTLPLREGTITLAFTDIEDSTPLAAQLGDRAWVEMLHEHQRGIDQVAGRHGGTVIKTLGDGAMISFASTREAVRAAIEMQQIQAAARSEIPLAMRVGIHVGDALASDGDYLGTTVNKAARIAAAGEGGQIMVSEAVRVLLSDESEFDFSEPSSMRLKGLEGVHLVSRVLW